MEAERKSLQTLCREAKDAMGLTSQELAERSGVPLSTVNNTFSTRSRDPSVYTIAPMCAVTGTSIDQYFRICPPAAPQELHDREITIARLEGQVEQLRRFIVAQEQWERKRRGMTAALAMLCAVLCAIIACYLIFDFNITNAGLIRDSTISVPALIIVAVTLAAAYFAGRALLHICRDVGAKTPPLPEENL